MQHLHFLFCLIRDWRLDTVLLCLMISVITLFWSWSSYVLQTLLGLRCHILDYPYITGETSHQCKKSKSFNLGDRIIMSINGPGDRRSLSSRAVFSSRFLLSNFVSPLCIILVDKIHVQSVKIVLLTSLSWRLCHT